MLASPRPILLLDEAMSNLDWVSRRRLLQCHHFQGRTVIYTSHEEVLTAFQETREVPLPPSLV